MIVVKRYLFVVSLTVLIVLSGFSSVMASDDSNTSLGENTSEQERHNQKVMLEKEKVLELLKKLGEHRSKKELDRSKKNGVSSPNDEQDVYEERLEKELLELGVSELSENEIASIQEKNITPNVDTPPSTSSVKWYSYRIGVYSGGQNYEVQELYAQGLNNNTNLANGRNGVTLYSNQQIQVNNLSNIASIYTQKAIGNVPVVRWLPYELLFSDNNEVTNNSHVITYRSLSTVCFSYVKREGQSDNQQSLSYVSNMVSIASSNTLAGYRDGSPYSRTTDKSNTDYATNYANATTAVNEYRNNTTNRSFISNYKFYNHNRTKSITQSIINPSYPVQIN